MTAAATSGTRPRRRFPRLQFSLRLLLVTFTAVAIGFPIWYRWPYTKETLLGSDDPFQPSVFKIVTTWRRTWGGGRVKHGPETRETPNGRSRVVKHYKDGVLDGPLIEYYNGKEIVVGRYVAGKKAGRWERRSSRGDIEFTGTWKDGKLDGLVEMRRPDGSIMALRFQGGSLVEIDGEPVSYSLAALKNRVRADSERLSTALDDSSMLEFVETPLKDALQILIDMHAIPLGRLRIEQSKVNVDLPVTAQLAEVDLHSALAVIGKLNDLAVDYRYGCLWMTTVDDASEWTDPTGVLAIQPEPGSLLADIWSEPVSASTVKTPLIPPFSKNVTQPLATVLQSLSTQVGIEIDTSQIDPTPDVPDRYPTVFHIDQHPFHQTLGILLYEAGCRCVLEGDRLVILPPENSITPRE